MKYLSVQEAASLWGVTKRRVQSLCVNNRINGAIRIGNVWAIPEYAEKPTDARLKCSNSADNVDSTRKIRRELKNIVEHAIDEYSLKGLSRFDSMKSLVLHFSYQILFSYTGENIKSLSICEAFFNYKLSENLSDRLSERISCFITEHHNNIDDTLSWVYQFSTKKSSDFEYSDTQFFTEKYMIKTIVDSLTIDSSSIILDPACGGGNFLLYAFEKIANEELGNTKSIKDINVALSKLIGYDIDCFLSHIATFNLKIKAISIYSKHEKASIDLFNDIHPLIYYPLKSDSMGFIDRDWTKHRVRNCGTGEETSLKAITSIANTIITNPPFRTIKGMPSKQKDYLQTNYPLSKCDLCNSFIERIMEVLPNNGKAGLVTQTSWMYLDSFSVLRRSLLCKYSIDNIWELGSSAFYDLSGEKANIALVCLSKAETNNDHLIEMHHLRNINIKQVEKALVNKNITPSFLNQTDIINSPESRFDLVSTKHLKDLLINCEKYSNYAVPMQGTSTGNAKELIDFFWNHIGDKDWVLVSKGGGYSRYEGLNSYSVKWGKDGKYIKETKGSALRNTAHFNDTQLVFSDTGTAGLNVRILMKKQIFVASGPGIRVLYGNPLSHLAFLNSRFAAFCVRRSSPKLTIAAGYIAQIPVKSEILNSDFLSQCASKCIKLKHHRLTKRANCIEFEPIKLDKNKNISEKAFEWFCEDIHDEWSQLVLEQQIEDYIYQCFEITDEDCRSIDNYIGSRTIFQNSNDMTISSDNLVLNGVLGPDCFPKRTKANKLDTGADGIIEYLSQETHFSCESIHSSIIDKYNQIEQLYIDLYMQAIVLSAVGFPNNMVETLTADEILERANVYNSNIEIANRWICTRFNKTHQELFKECPIFEYDSKQQAIKRKKGKQ